MTPRRGTLLATTLAIAAALGGCRQGPDYERPELPMPVAYAAGQGQAASIANQPWWELLQDPVLQELIDVALEQNKDAAIAWERIEQARAVVDFTRASLFPIVDLFATGTEGDASRNSVPNGPRSTDSYAAGAGVAWELDFFGRLSRATEADQRLLLATEEGYRNVILALVADVARTYFELRELDSSLAIANETLETDLHYVQLTHTRFEGGVVSELDWRQAQSQAYRTQALALDLQRLVERAEHALSVLLGRAPGPVLRGFELSAQPFPPEVPAGLPSELLDRRPDVREAEELLASATARIGEAKAILFPRVVLTGNGGLSSSDLSDLVDPDSDFWNLSADLVQPLFNSGRNKAGVRIAEAQQRQALSAYERTVLEALREVEDGLSDYRSLLQQRQVQDSRVEAESEFLRLAQLRYEGGVASYLEVLIAQRSLLDAQLAREATTRAHLVALVRLYKALGGGWTPAPARGDTGADDDPGR